MRTRTAFLVVAALLAAFTFSTQPFAKADTFGTSGNEFTIDFVNIGNLGNAPDRLTGYGAVSYAYRMGVYEISQSQIERATASGLANVTAGAYAGGPAGAISWFEAAAFVNWMNISTGRQAPYNLTFSGGSWSMALWSGADAWTSGGTNLYRHKDAFYFLPSENEWYKAAYFTPLGTNYFLYPTGSSTAPTPVTRGTNAGTAVYGVALVLGPAAVDKAGGLSPFGTMGQGGNVWEWVETARDGDNSSPSEQRVIRGGYWFDSSQPGAPNNLQSWGRLGGDPSSDRYGSSGGIAAIGFRVASVPEPSTYALLLTTGAGALSLLKRKRN